MSEVGCGSWSRFWIQVARAAPGDLVVADPGGVLGTGGDLIGDLLALDPYLGARAGRAPLRRLISALAWHWCGGR